MKKCTVGTHKNCAELSIGDFRIAVTTEVGPRVIGCFIGDDDNMFAVLPKRPLKPNCDFKLYGGHRLWHAPEEFPRSYFPDNNPVKVTELETGLEFSCDVEADSGIRKKITIEPLENGMFVVTHTLTNCNQWPVELAPWALSVMAPGGMCVIPQLRDEEGYPYAPDRALHLWAYSSFNDPRLVMEKNYVFLKQDSTMKNPVKIGMNDEMGWVAYVRNGKALIKYFDVMDSSEGDYPDNGCTVESFTNDKFCEVETLGVLEELESGESSQHVEYWQGISGLPEIKTAEDFDKYVLPHIIQPEEDYEDDECCCGDDDCCCDDEDGEKDTCECGHHDCKCGKH